MTDNDTVEVRESPGQGLGVFARRDFAPGERIRVVNLVRDVTPEAPLRPELGERPEHCNHNTPGGVPVLYGEPDRYYNHGCDPNAWERYLEGRTEIVARRTIAAGEEIRIDYLVNNSGGDSWPCSCGAPRCRGNTGISFFTLPEEFQREYLPLLAGWFIARHPEQMATLRAKLEPDR